MKLAVWSGPRNISTAMMYAFGNRADFAAVDEPFYAAYLALTGLEHPMRQEIMDSQDQDALKVIEALTGPNPGGAAHVYHKHMAQHMLPEIPRDWFGPGDHGEMKHVFLIRHPARVAASFSAKYDNPTLADIGFYQQAQMYAQLQTEGQQAVVIDSVDIRNDPEGMLRALCDALGLAWDPAMLGWPQGPKPHDGVWADHWYAAVHGSTGFAGPEGEMPQLDHDTAYLARSAMPYYENLWAKRLTV